MMFFCMHMSGNIIKKKGGALLSLLRIMALKRISAHSSDKSFAASMTVEACFVLPFFLFAFLNIISITEIYRLQGNMSAAMHDTAKQMAVYGYEYREIRGGSSGAAESLGLTYLYAASKVRAKLGDRYFNNAPISGGASSILWTKSSIMSEDDCIDLVAEYCITPPVAVVGYPERIMYNRLRTRAWTGYDNISGGAGSGDGEIVYITPEGTVYHSSRGCSYLKLSISACDKGFLDKYRNEDGEKYYRCEECGNADTDTDTVYITNYGNRYHTTLGCSRLKRTIIAVPISDTDSRGVCSKCAKH